LRWRALLVNLQSKKIERNDGRQRQQNRDGNQLEVSVPKDLLANLLWFQRIKNLSEAAHLPEA